MTLVFVEHIKSKDPLNFDDSIEAALGAVLVAQLKPVLPFGVLHSSNRSKFGDGRHAGVFVKTGPFARAELPEPLSKLVIYVQRPERWEIFPVDARTHPLKAIRFFQDETGVLFTVKTIAGEVGRQAFDSK